MRTVLPVCVKRSTDIDADSSKFASNFLSVCNSLECCVHTGVCIQAVSSVREVVLCTNL